jgi:hypothetical protein
MADSLGLQLANPPERPAGQRDIYRDAALARCTPLHFSDGMTKSKAARVFCSAWGCILNR